MYFPRRITQWFVWTLITAFMLVVVGKYQHSHTCCGSPTPTCHLANVKSCPTVVSHVSDHQAKKALVDTSTTDVPVVKALCNICDFHFFASSVPVFFHYNPFLETYQTAVVERLLKLIYRPILLINAHSPPFAL
ncbi:MAG: hypothetical protein Q4D66_04695 [Bacteroidales bacterium]|nr:hypothetical protein [Bacteroidales bacterium]